MGWEPRTVYTYDAGGRLVSSQPEVEWDEDERAWMLALGAYRSGLCPVCGGPSDECQSPETLEEARSGRFVVEQSTCLRTVQLRKEMDRIAESATVPEAAVLMTRRR